ncbi:endonuclease/exonuclease/phosphatase family protein [Alteribacillus bidgolensis]|uniref:Maltose 6'-phosphate phosphatase n=1 Tax=Alteribacillus bidgolensis TaxID=930129 RepID=A0A1G8LTU0_9BACI|nr:endonuclease/exonuclease/phosphatase family protein [Alteribacillus bidgolensis]SDI59141.1 maltose 6'-phosphate phosphatase [Alteribacillus bidgolensis]
MRLLTLNVHSWQEEDQLDKIKTLARVIQGNDYDVIALQEVSQHIDSSLVYKNIRKDNYALLVIQELQKLGNTQYQLLWDVSHYGYDEYEEGLALLTRHPVKKEYSFYVSKSKSKDNWKARKIAGGTLLVNGSPFSFYSCHLGWWGDKEEPYEQQVERLIKGVNHQHPFVLLGDFNAADTFKEEGYDYVIKQGLFDTHLHRNDVTIKGNIAGWEENVEGLKIDHIFTSWKPVVSHSRIICNGKNEPIISDHFGVDVQLE